MSPDEFISPVPLRVLALHFRSHSDALQVTKCSKKIRRLNSKPDHIISNDFTEADSPDRSNNILKTMISGRLIRRICLNFPNGFHIKIMFFLKNSGFLNLRSSLGRSWKFWCMVREPAAISENFGAWCGNPRPSLKKVVQGAGTN